MHLVTLDRAEEKPFYRVAPGVTVHGVHQGDTRRKTRLSEVPRMLWNLRTAVQAIRPDMVVAFMHSMYVPMQIALLGTGIPVILSEHTVPQYYATRRLEFLILRAVSALTPAITIASDQVAALYPLSMRKKMSVLKNPAYSDYSRADVTGEDKPRKTILSVGRLDPGKDHAILIEAFSLLAREHPDWDLVIYGEGPERAALERMVAARGLTHRVSLPGVVEDIDRAYEGAQLFVFPSRYESFGLVSVEAMSHGLPVIGFSDCSGTNIVIRDGVNGRLVERRTAENLAAAMRNLMESSLLRETLGLQGIQTAREYAPEAVGDLWASFLSGLKRA